MFEYRRNTMGIKEQNDLENATIGLKQVDEITGAALVEIGDLVAGNMDAITELADMIANLMSRIEALETSNDI